MRAGREKQQLCWAPCGCGTAILPAPQGAVTVGAAMGCSIPQRQCLPPSTHPPVQHKASAPTASSLLKMGTVWLAPSKPSGFPSFPTQQEPCKSRPWAQASSRELQGCTAVLQPYGYGSPAQSRRQDLTAQAESASRCRLFPGSQHFRPLDHAAAGITKLLLSWPEVREHTSFLACSNQHRASISSAPYPEQ